MKKLNLLVLFIAGLSLFSCSKEESPQLNETNKKYLKAVTKPDLVELDKDQFFKYNQEGLLTEATGWTTLSGTYEYDSDGKLIRKTNYKGVYTYEYDAQDRIIKEIKVGTNDYIELIYHPGKVVTKRYYEYGGGPQNYGGSVLEERELHLNSQGKIVKMVDLAQDQSAIDIEYQEYLYDSNGNIIKITIKILDDPEEFIIHIGYDDKINPYYIAFEKYYELTYYLENYLGVNVYNWDGLTPNNMISRGSENRHFVYDDDGYPISLKGYDMNGSSSAESFFEYYE